MRSLSSPRNRHLTAGEFGGLRTAARGQAGAQVGEITEEMVERACVVLAESGLLYFELFEKEPSPGVVRRMLEAAFSAKPEVRRAKAEVTVGLDRN
jgi:hypothetical protein